MPWYEIVGYAGSVLVAVSLMMRNILKLRWINFAGAATFAFYGGVISAYPVLALNGFIAFVNLYYIYDIYKKKDYFTLSSAGRDGDNYLAKFLDFYKNDIEQFFPHFYKEKPAEAEYYFILRNLVPAGLFVYKKESEDTIKILIDYAVPDYRDFKNARFLYYNDSNYFNRQGYKKLVTESFHPDHEKYLKKIGFKKEGEYFILYC